jgi:hypothetical protein
MINFAIDPELRIRGLPETVLRQSDEALTYIRKKVLSFPDGPWRDILRSFETIQDEWGAMEAVVRLEILLEGEGLLFEEKPSELPLPSSGNATESVFSSPRSR